MQNIDFARVRGADSQFLVPVFSSRSVGENRILDGGASLLWLHLLSKKLCAALGCANSIVTWCVKGARRAEPASLAGHCIVPWFGCESGGGDDAKKKPRPNVAQNATLERGTHLCCYLLFRYILRLSSNYSLVQTAFVCV